MFNKKLETMFSLTIPYFQPFLQLQQCSSTQLKGKTFGNIPICFTVEEQPTTPIKVLLNTAMPLF